MSLTLGLAILGGAVLAGVLGHGVWSARRAGPRQPGPPLVPVEPREPTFDASPPAAAAPDAAAPAEAPAFAASAEAPPKPPRRATPRLDALIDAIAPLRLEAPASGESALLHLPPSRRAGSKPLLVEGLNETTGEWEPPAPGQRYREFQAGVQLANRAGAINEIEYSEFVQKLQAFADAIGAVPEPPDMLDVVARARELDAFAGSHDAQLAVHLKANGAAWSLGYVAQHAARQGFVHGAVPGRLVRPGAEEGAPPVLTLGFDAQAAMADDPSQAALADLTLALDVPQTPAEAEPFAQWQDAARALAADLDASVVDDAGRPLPLAAFETIGSELQQLYAALAERDLAAGSPAARRLFS